MSARTSPDLAQPADDNHPLENSVVVWYELAWLHIAGAGSWFGGIQTAAFLHAVRF